MEWEEYKKQEKNKFEISGSNDWIKTEIICPKCRSRVYKNIGMVLTTYPLNINTNVLVVIGWVHGINLFF